MKPTKKNTGIDFHKDANLGANMDADDEPISKTKLKAEADAQQELGVKLSALSKDKLLKLDLPDTVLTAILDTKKITANGATRRHKQYLGRLMREIDNAPILEQLARWEGKNTAENAYFHGLERWRDRMIADSNVLAEFIGLYPNTEIQQLRTLVRNAQKELAADKPPKSSREIFKLLRDITQATAADDADNSAREPEHQAAEDKTED